MMTKRPRAPRGRPIPRGKPRGVSSLFRRPEDGFVSYRVKSHGLDATVMAKDDEDAFRSAMLTANPEALGDFVSFTKADGIERWAVVASMLRRTGFSIVGEEGS